MCDYEKLGEFYMGRQGMSELFMLDSRDLLTHGVILGMTGSGKTGLGIGLIEEAAIDGVPVIAIDPKGDLGNIALGFPNMQPADLEPWVSADEARQKGISTAELASQYAQLWRNGLMQWQQVPERTNLMYRGAEVAIYTPGSTAGIPVSMLSSWTAPGAEVLEDGEVFNELVNGAVSSLLSLLKIDYDPLSSREYLLLSSIFAQSWMAGCDLDLAALITKVQTPPFTKLGMFDLESLYPAKDRFALAMALNGMMVSPSFQLWLQGVPLDIANILYTPQGKPRVAIFSIAHLNDSERMFFVTMLANATLAWMRRQVGTSSLRALFYMDEVAGYLPPNGNPPSKRPIMTMFKQARAFGLGLVMASQNPVDFDYKALSNAGVWLVGRLQTPQDRAKVKASLEAALGARASEVDLDQQLGALAKRQFLAMTPGKTPFSFESRWTLSFLRGPMTRDDIKRVQSLLAARQGDANALSSPAQAPYVGMGAAMGSTMGVGAPATMATPAAVPGTAPRATAPVVLPADIPQCWLEASRTATAYRPMLLGAASIQFVNAKYNVNYNREVVRVLEIDDSAFTQDWADSVALDIPIASLQRSGDEDLANEEIPAPLCQSKAYKGWNKDLGTWIYRNETLTLFSCPQLKLIAKVNESERDYRVRLAQLAREERDRKADAIRAKFEPKIQRVQERLVKANNAKENQEKQAAATKSGSMLSLGSSLLGLFGGRKRSMLSAATSAYKQYNRGQLQDTKAQQAEARCNDIAAELEDLRLQLDEALGEIPDASEIAQGELEAIEIAPKKTDIVISFCGLGWVPIDAQGNIAIA